MESLHEELKMTPVEAQQQQQQQQQSLSAQILDEYVAAPLSKLTLEQLGTQAMQTMAQADAEQVRLGLREVGRRRAVTAPEQAAPLPEDAYAGLSGRQRRKLQSRGKDALKKAQQRGIPGATEDTLGYQRQLTEYLRVREAAIGRVPDDVENFDCTDLFSADLFQPRYTEARDTPLNAAYIAESIDLTTEMLRKYQLRKGALSIEQQARYDTLYQTLDAAKYAYAIIMAANGIDAETGQPLPVEQVEAARAQKNEVLAHYQRTVTSRLDRNLDRIEALLSPMVEQTRRQVDEDDRRHIREEVLAIKPGLVGEELERAVQARDTKAVYLERVEKLDFEFSYFQSAEQYIGAMRLIDDHPETYAQHKQLIDRMFAEFTDCQRVSSDANKQMKAFTLAALGPGDGEPLVDVSLQGHIQIRMSEAPELKAAQVRISILQSAMKYLLTGGEIPAVTQIVLEHEFGILTEERARIKAGLETLAQVEQLNERFEREERELRARREQAEYMPATEAERTALVSERIIDINLQKENSYAGNRALINAAVTLDKRALKIFAHGYRTDENGQPLTLLDEEKKDLDRKYYEDMTSGDNTLIAPHLDRITAEMLDFEPHEELLQGENLVRNAAQLSSIINKMVYFENVMHDHAWYFNALAKDKRELIDQRFTMFKAFNFAFQVQLNVCAINCNSGEVYTENVQGMRAMGASMLNQAMDALKLARENYQDYKARHDNYYGTERRQRTPEETAQIATTYTRIYRGKYRELDACLEDLKALGELDNAQIAAFRQTEEYSRGSFRMDPPLGRETNLARLRSELVYMRIKRAASKNAAAALKERATAEGAAAEDVQAYERLQADYALVRDGIKSEALNLFHYANQLELTEDQVLDRAEEFCRTEMSAMHISDITGKITNPVTGKTLKQELMADPEHEKMFSVIVTRLSSYKCAIRSVGLSQEETTLGAAEREHYLIGNEIGNPGSVREVLLKEYARKKSIEDRFPDNPTYITMIERARQGDAMPRPDGMPPQPLYRA